MTQAVTVHCTDGFRTLLAARDFMSGEVVIAMEKYVVLSTPTRYSIQIDFDRHVDFVPELKDSPHCCYRFLNHGCDPNLMLDAESLRFVALKSICRGDELRFNYNSTEFDMKEPFACSCGAEGCVGTVAGFRHADQLQRRAMAGYMSRYLVEYSRSCGAPS